MTQRRETERCTCWHKHDDHARVGGYCLIDECDCKMFVPRPPLPNMFPCGCSRLKVSIGRCDTYDRNGEVRTAGTTHV